MPTGCESWNLHSLTHHALHDLLIIARTLPESFVSKNSNISPFFWSSVKKSSSEWGMHVPGSPNTNDLSPDGKENAARLFNMTQNRLP